MIFNKHQSRICLSIANQSYKGLKQLLSNCQLAELRLDYSVFSDKELEVLLNTRTQIIVACRTGKLTDSERINRLKQAIEFGVTYVDVEIDSDKDFISEMVSYARKKNCKLIISYHNFTETPTQIELQEIINKAEVLGADLVKVACIFRHLEDEKIIKNLYRKNKNLIAFGMGELGKNSRIDCLEWGAKFTYASVQKGQETADGQWTFAEMNERLKNKK